MYRWIVRWKKAKLSGELRFGHTAMKVSIIIPAYREEFSLV